MPRSRALRFGWPLAAGRPVAGPIITPPTPPTPAFPTFFDDFNRADQALETDARYAVRSGSAAANFGVLTNRLRSQAANAFTDLVQTFAPDHEVEISAVTGVTNASFIATRQQANGDYLGLRISNNTVQVIPLVNAAYGAALVSVAGTANGDKVRWEILGGEVRVFRNGVLIGSAAIPTALFTGDRIAFHSRSAGLNFIDDLRIAPRSSFSA